MSQLAANTPQIFEDDGINNLPVAASTQIFLGSAVGDNGSGYARQLVAGDPFRGFALGSVNNNASTGGVGLPSTTGAAGALNVAVKYRGLILAAISGVAITSVNASVYMSDGGTFTLTSTSNTFVGRVHRFVATGQAVVRFDVNVLS